MFCNPGIRSQAFSEPRPLDCELYKRLKIFSLPLGGRGCLEWAGETGETLDSDVNPREI